MSPDDHQKLVAAHVIMRHSVVGPREDGIWLVVYVSEEGARPTVRYEFSSRDAAEREARRLNAEQFYREEVKQMPGRLSRFRKGSSQ